MADDPDVNTSSDEDTNDYFKNPMKRRQHDIQKLNLQNKEMLMMAGRNRNLAQAIAKQKDLTKMIQQNQTKNFANTSLCGCTTTSRFRSCVMTIVFNPWFDKFILLIIFANCISLAVEDPALEEPDPFIEALDLAFLIIFSIEMVLKIIAMGFAWEAHSYLRDPWNILDFSVVILGWFSLSAKSLNVSAIRVIRILRPLRTLNSLQGMRGLVLTLLNSLPSMLNILLLFLFTLLIFGTIGVQLFKGMFQTRCVEIITIGTINADGESLENFLQNLDGEEVYCQHEEASSAAFICPDDYQCLIRGNPGVGLQNWDNIFWAMLTQFELITLEGWSDVMYKVRNANGGSQMTDFFFYLSVILGAFFVLNLMIAVQFNFLNEAFEEVEEKKKKEKKLAEQEKIENEQQRKQTEAIKSAHDEELDTSIEKEVKVSCWEKTKLKYDDLDEKAKTCCCSCWRDKVVPPVYALVESKKFVVFIVLMILANSVALATEHYEQPEWLTEAQKIANIAFTFLFTFEMILNMIGRGLKVYLSDGFNVFDAIIVLLSLLDFGITVTSDGGESAGFITVLRGFRLLRVFKLVKSWTTLQQLLGTIVNSFSAISNLAVLALLFLFVYSLIGKQFFFGDMIDEEGEVTRYHFNSTPDAMITMFIVLTGENWNYVMATVVLAHPDKTFLAVVYFVSACLIGNFMLLNLFLAILLKYLEDAVEEVRRAKEIEREKRMAEANLEDQQKAIEIGLQKDQKFKEKIYKQTGAQNQGQGNNAQHQNIPLNPPADNDAGEGSLRSDKGFFEDPKAKEIADNNSNSTSKLVQNRTEVVAGPPGKGPVITVVGDTGILRQQKQGDIIELKKQKSVGFIVEENQQEANQKQNEQIEDQNTGGLRRTLTDYTSNMQKSEQKVIKKKKRINEIIIDGKALGCIPETQKVRIFLGKVAENPYFEAFVFNLIGLNSLFLAIEEPTLDEPYAKSTLELFGNVISALFIGECLIKIYVMGFVKGKFAYLKDNYNILDFVIVVFSILSWVLESLDTGIDISYLKALRALRALRPLKLVSKNEGMKLVVNSILASIPNLINVFLISILFFFVFGVLGLSILMGRVSYCSDPNGSDDFNETIKYELNKEPCIEKGYDWLVPQNNYNNIFASMVTFFEVSTLETWPDIMFDAVDSASEPDMAPQLFNRSWISILFIAFIFVTTFFVMNLFISVIVGQFNEQKEKSEGSARLSDEQKEWVKIQRFMAEVKAPVIEVVPTNIFRLKVYNLVRKEWFDHFITLVILMNTITMCMDHYGASDDYLAVLDYCNLIFVIIFTFEAVLKLIGLGPTYYFYIDWNKFDFSVCVMSLISLGENDEFNLTALRIIRVARLLRMIKSSKELQSLLMTLYLAINNIANVALLFMLIIFTFAVAGMTLFGDILEGQYEMINQENLNFRGFYNSVSVLLRSSTGESWNNIMHDCAFEKGIIAYCYWLIFQLFAFFIFLNVFIAVIYEEFQNVNQVESTLEVLSLKKRDIQSFLDTWGMFNQSGQHYMPTTKFTEFMRKLPAPLGYKGLNIEKSKLDKIIFCLNIRDHEGFVYFPEVMWAIFYSIIGKNDAELHQCKPMRNIMRKVKNKYSGLGRNTSLDMLCGNKFYRNEMTITKYLCGRVILDNLRILQKRRLESEAEAKQQSAGLGRTTVYLQKEREKHKKSSMFLVDLWRAITRRASEMQTHDYQAKKIRIVRGESGGIHAYSAKSDDKASQPGFNQA